MTINNNALMTIILIHKEKIQHYRVLIYNYLYEYLLRRGYRLIVISGGTEKGVACPVEFEYLEINLNTLSIFKQINKYRPDAVISHVNLKHLYLFPTLFLLKLKGVKTIYWDHGLDLQDKNNFFKNLAYRAEHSLFDGILLYADHLKKYIARKHHKKVFIANNTLNTTVYDSVQVDKAAVKAKYGIITSRNIICMGRVQKRKRIFDLVAAFKKLKTNDVGLILAGPDPEGLLKQIEHRYIYKPGPVYGDDAIKLLSVCDLYCLPGPIGLSIVDAFYCGLPMVTENVQHGPEIMYFKEGVNGFMVDKGDIQELAEKIDIILSDDDLRHYLSTSARKGISSNGHISTMCQGFVSVLDYVLKGKDCETVSRR